MVNIPTKTSPEKKTKFVYYGLCQSIVGLDKDYKIIIVKRGPKLDFKI